VFSSPSFQKKKVYHFGTKHHAIFFSKKVIILYFEFLASKATKQNKTKPQEALMKTINSTF